MKGRLYGLEAHKEILEALGRVLGEWLWYFRDWIHLDSTAAIFIEKS